MQRVRGSEIVILEPTKGRRRRPGAGKDLITVELDVPKRFAVDFDVRRLVDRLRLAIGRELRADASPALAKLYELGPITGGPARARTWLRNKSRSADSYFAARFDVIAPDIIARETDAWIVESCPAGEALPSANLNGGPLPR